MRPSTELAGFEIHVARAVADLLAVFALLAILAILALK
jgi:hypothetical protein